MSITVTKTLANMIRRTFGKAPSDEAVLAFTAILQAPSEDMEALNSVTTAIKLVLEDAAGKPIKKDDLLVAIRPLTSGEVESPEKLKELMLEALTSDEFTGHLGKSGGYTLTGVDVVKASNAKTVDPEHFEAVKAAVDSALDANKGKRMTSAVLEFAIMGNTGGVPEDKVKDALTAVLRTDAYEGKKGPGGGWLKVTAPVAETESV